MRRKKNDKLEGNSPLSGFNYIAQCEKWLEITPSSCKYHNMKLSAVFYHVLILQLHHSPTKFSVKKIFNLDALLDELKIGCKTWK